MQGYRFTEFHPDKEKDLFEHLLKIFLELLTYTAGDADEAMAWMNELDREYNLTNEEYSMADFIDELKEKGYLKDDDRRGGGMKISAKTEQGMRQKALEEVFGKLKKGQSGNHRTPFSGKGDEVSPIKRPFEFGDTMDSIAMTDSMRNAQINHGIDDFKLTEGDLEVNEQEFKTQTATVMMIDISHSMILYGEDRITPAKKVAMALAELIRRKYPKDSLDIIVFGNDAWEIKLKDLPYLQVGPFHTNTVAGLELAMDILRRKKGANKQIFMITDGKPTCLKVGMKYYKNSWGLDKKILGKCMNLAQQARKLKIPVTTFMLAQDSWLVKFVKDFTEANNGRAYYSGLNGLGEFVFEDYERNRKRTIR